MSLARADLEALTERLKAAGHPTFVAKEGFGARGRATSSVYFHDPDQNVIEARAYD